MIAEHMRNNGRKLTAIVVDSCMDLRLRQCERAQIQVGKVAYDGQENAIRLRAAERGQRAKTGRNQGATMDSTTTTQEGLDPIQERPSSEEVFYISATEFLKLWESTKHAMSSKLGHLMISRTQGQPYTSSRKRAPWESATSRSMASPESVHR